jgi:hypothetical protein
VTEAIELTTGPEPGCPVSRGVIVDRADDLMFDNFGETVPHPAPDGDTANAVAQPERLAHVSSSVTFVSSLRSDSGDILMTNDQRLDHPRGRSRR